MMIDNKPLDSGAKRQCDLCIIGGGAAGIAVSVEFIGTPVNVILLISGEPDFDEDTQPLYRGENVGLPYYGVETARLRYFGGTTNHWNGWCRALDRLDFEKRLVAGRSS